MKKGVSFVTSGIGVISGGDGGPSLLLVSLPLLTEFSKMIFSVLNVGSLFGIDETAKDDLVGILTPLEAAP